MIGFGGLLLIMALAGTDALLVLRQFQGSEARIRNRYLSQNHVLERLSGPMFTFPVPTCGITFLEPDPARAETYRNQSGRRSKTHGGPRSNSTAARQLRRSFSIIRLCGWS